MPRLSAAAQTKVAQLSLDRPTLKSAGTRARIVQGALRVLETHGLQETTTRRIAEEAGVRLATLHYHFTNKEGLLLAVFETILSQFTDALEANIPKSETLDARIAEVAWASWAHSHATRETQIVQYELTIYALRTAGSEWLAKQQYHAYVETYAMLLRGPRIDISDAQSQELARLLLAGIDGLILQMLTDAPDDRLGPCLAGVIAGVQARALWLGRQSPNSRHDADA